MKLTREQAALLEVSKSVINNHQLAADCFQDIDWSILINLLQQHKIFALTYENIAPILPDSLKNRVKPYTKTMWKLSMRE